MRGHVAVRVDLGGDTESDGASDDRPRVICSHGAGLPHRKERFIGSVARVAVPGFRDRGVFVGGVDHELGGDRGGRPRVVRVQIGEQLTQPFAGGEVSGLDGWVRGWVVVS